MAGVAELKLAVDSLKLIADLAKGLGAIKSSADREAKLVELLKQVALAEERIAAAARRETDLIKRASDLEAENERLKSWEAEKQRYESKRIPPGTLVYVLKQESVKPGEALHMLCYDCYAKGKQGVFDMTSELDMGHTVFECSNCGKRRAFDYGELSQLGLVG